MRSNDVDAAINLTQFPCVVSGPQGVRSITENDYRRMMSQMDGSKYQGITLKNPQVQKLSEDTAVLTYAISCDGQEMLDTSVWTKNGYGWQCGFHSEFPSQRSQS